MRQAAQPGANETLNGGWDVVVGWHHGGGGVRGPPWRREDERRSASSSRRRRRAKVEGGVGCAGVECEGSRRRNRWKARVVGGDAELEGRLCHRRRRGIVVLRLAPRLLPRRELAGEQRGALDDLGALQFSNPEKKKGACSNFINMRLLHH